VIRAPKMNTEKMKWFNARSVLQIIAHGGDVSRSDIAMRMDLSRPSVSALVEELIDANWVVETGELIGGRGRRPVTLALNHKGHHVVGVEIGAYRCVVIVCALDASVIAQRSFSINPGALPEFVLANVARSIEDCLLQANCDRSRVLGVGVAMHGVVDPVTGVSVFAPNLGWRDVNIRDLIESSVQLPVLVENDCNASTLGEYIFGAGKGEDSFIELILDYGIGSGFLLAGKVFRGAHNTEGQIGHVVVDESGPLCGCGNHGCLEAVASETAVVAQVRKRLSMCEPSVLQARYADRLPELAIGDIYQAVRLGDQLARDVVMLAGRHIGVGVVNLINLLNPRTVILAGGMAEVSDILLPVVREVVAHRALGAAAKRTQILASRLGSNVFTLGAASLFLAKVYDGTILPEGGAVS